MRDFRIGRLNGRYVVTWTEDGRRRRYRLDARTRAEAEAKALDVIRRETMPQTGQTVAAIWNAYREEKAGRRVADAMAYEAKAVLGHFGHYRPDQIDIELSRAYTAKRRKGGRGDGTIWTELGHLRTALKWAVSRRMITFAPDIERPAKPAPKGRWLTHAEIERLLSAQMAEHIRLAIVLMLGTAGRVSAILELKWDRVDFERGVIDLRTDDTGPRKGRATVPMNAGLKAALSRARQAALSEYVIEWAGKPVASIKTGFNAATKAAGLEDVTPHVLRHTAAVHMAAAGRPMARIAQYLGHSSTAVTERVYARYAPDHLREEADILDFANVRKAKA